MAKIDLYDTKGAKTGFLELPKEIFGAKTNDVLVAQAVRVYLANQRRARAKVKTRSEVTGSGKKIWRQKGTGRARHGDRYAPIFVGGGRAHGPTGRENYSLKLSKKMKRQALFSVLSAKLRDGQIIAVKGLSRIDPKTKKMQAVLTKLIAVNNWDPSKAKITLIMPAVISEINRSARNLSTVALKQAAALNSYEMLNAGYLVMMEESLAVLEKTYLQKEK